MEPSPQAEQARRLHHKKIKPVIGILGGVGSGKSTAAAEFVRLGCQLIDADRIGHEVLEEKEVKGLLKKTFGEEIVGADGRVSREKVSRIVFGSTRPVSDDAAGQEPRCAGIGGTLAQEGRRANEQLDKLNAIMWPRIRSEIERAIAAGRAEASIPAMVLDAAIMIEAGWDDLCTHLMFVEAPTSERSRRVQADRGWAAGQWESRENSQISLDTKRSRCYFTLDNSSSVSYLAQQIRAIFNQVVCGSDQP